MTHRFNQITINQNKPQNTKGFDYMQCRLQMEIKIEIHLFLCTLYTNNYSMQSAKKANEFLY